MTKKKEVKKEITKAIPYEESDKRIRLTANSVVVEFEDTKENRTKAFSRLSGCRDRDASHDIIGGVASSLMAEGKSDIDKINLAFGYLEGIDPQDTLEGMLAAQMIVTHNLAMKMARQATHPDQPAAIAAQYSGQSAKLMNTFNNQLTALQKYRSKGQQTIQVQHVNVEAGGQAVVGNVTRSKG